MTSWCSWTHSLLPSYLPSFLLLAELDESQLQKPQVANCMHGYQIHLMCQNIHPFLSVVFSVLSIYSELLLQTQKPHIRQFAVESFGFLLRKVHACDCV